MVDGAGRPESKFYFLKILMKEFGGTQFDGSVDVRGEAAAQVQVWYTRKVATCAAGVRSWE